MDASILEADAFAGGGHDQWLKLAEKALKGADFSATLRSASDDNLLIEPLYPRKPGAQALAHQHAAAAWVVSQRMDDPDAKRALVHMAEELENGATGISLVMADSPASYGLGLDDGQSGVIAKMAAARATHGYSIRLEAGASVAGTALTLGRAIAEAGSAGAVVHFGLDPVATAAFDGEAPAGSKLADGFSELAGLKLGGTILKADGRVVHNAGGTEAQELAFVATTLAKALRQLDGAGIAPEAVFAATGIVLSADQDQFMTIAKARAARLIHARLQQACGIADPAPAHLAMETSYRMLTRLDPETNILRNTIAVFAAGTGGADEVSVLPHTLTHGIPDPLARRLARNTQVILIAESHLDQVADPAAGAGGIEALTDALCEKAWQIFTGIEKDGGIAKALSNGSFQSAVKASAQSRAARPIVGTTLFPMKEERPVTVLGPLTAPKAGAQALSPVLFADLAQGDAQ